MNNSKLLNCNTCGKRYSATCDFMQGRCPHHPPALDTTSIQHKFKILLDFFTRNK